jgi:hypothetical protein
VLDATGLGFSRFCLPPPPSRACPGITGVQSSSNFRQVFSLAHAREICREDHEPGRVLTVLTARPANGYDRGLAALQQFRSLLSSIIEPALPSVTPALGWLRLSACCTK